ncbi:hypothetical protein KVT40_008976 [Elsinoe batatas]|uniref:Uncharacterized protein n=1 Tax=Elsinoe batatas TaxID=2601811 RepID=A0A8K0P9Z2_9PEZI|nr:hypothetical protein KVT40_008976 [Elsinoe batatas]
MQKLFTSVFEFFSSIISAGWCPGYKMVLRTGRHHNREEILEKNTKTTNNDAANAYNNTTDCSQLFSMGRHSDYRLSCFSQEKSWLDPEVILEGDMRGL